MSNKKYSIDECIIAEEQVIKRKLRRLWLPIGIVAIVFCCLGGGISIWMELVEKDTHKKPAYAMKSIEHLLHTEKLTEDEYKLLSQQTGLATTALDYLYANERQWELLEIQSNYFAEVDVDCEENTLITNEERIEEIKFTEGTKDAGRRMARRDVTRVSIPYVEEGDILITFNCHAFGWRNGHAAMVVDAESREVIEAQVLGRNSTIVSMNHWERYPSFVVLRLKEAAKEQREAIAAYAAEKLIDIPYQLEAGILSRTQHMLGKTIDKETETSLPGTHCAHLIWHAYKQSGYDLDSDGGVIVTPRDIYESPLLEIVQIYGM